MTTYSTEETSSFIEHRFGPYRKPTGETAPKFKQIQQKALEFALLIDSLCPNGREKSTALTLLVNTKMQANAAIALNEGEPNPTT